MLEEHLKDHSHDLTLSQGQGANYKVRWEGRLRNRDYAARPLAMGQIRAVVLVSFLQAEQERLQEGGWEGIRKVMHLSLSP